MTKNVRRLNMRGMNWTREALLQLINTRTEELGWSWRRIVTEIEKRFSGAKNLLTYDNLKDFKAGHTQMLRGDKLGQLVSVLTLSGNGLSKVLHYVGAGSEVLAYDDHASGACLEEVEPPIGYLADEVVAARVQGDSMEPMMEDGFLIFYKREYDGVPPDCLGHWCVVKLQNDGMLVKKVRQGSKPGLFHLLSKNPKHDPIIDAQVIWASKVIDIRPS